MNDEHDTVLIESKFNQPGNALGVFLLILFKVPALLIGLLLFSTVKDYIQASKKFAL